MPRLEWACASQIFCVSSFVTSLMFSSPCCSRFCRHCRNRAASDSSSSSRTRSSVCVIGACSMVSSSSTPL
uniref:Putative secreted protein n=1 Tax=Anopheles triannulatus TaxID=58253 RepID=A0A2M4B4G2_9DIPT